MTTDRAPAPATDDWIEWHGGENPVPGQRVEIRERSGRQGLVFSESVIWSHPSGVRPSRDIIAYRLSRPAASEGVGDRIGTHSPSCWSFGPRHYECALSRIAELEAALASPPVSERERELEGMFAALRENSWDLRCISLPTGGDDCDIGWRVVGHWQAKPCERTIAEVFHDDPAAAVRAALTAQPAGEGK